MLLESNSIRIIDEVGNQKQLIRSEYYIDLCNIFSYNPFYCMQISCFENYDMVGTNEYWIKLLKEFCLIDISRLEKTLIYWKGKLLGKEFISDLSIAIGLNQDGTIGYIIKDKEDKILYQTSEVLKNQSNFVDFGRFVHEFGSNFMHIMSSLELSSILNNYYLQEILESENFFYNVIIEDEAISFIPSYQITIYDDNNIYNAELGECCFENNNGEINLSPIEYVNLFGEKVYLKDVFNYYGILNEQQLEYEFTKEELMQYYQNYISDISLQKSKSRQMIENLQ